MTAADARYVEYVKDQLTSLRGIASARFFGGVGLSSAGTQFAMVMGSSLYFVVDDATRGKYEEMGSTCFTYGTSKGRVAVKKYYEVPAELIEDSDQLTALARESIRVARSSKGSPAKRRSRAKRALA
jgi:DNA transformation protein and related proteins